MKKILTIILACAFLLPAALGSTASAETKKAKTRQHVTHKKAKGGIKSAKRVRGIKKHHKIKKNRIKKAQSATQLGGPVIND